MSNWAITAGKYRLNFGEVSFSVILVWNLIWKADFSWTIIYREFSLAKKYHLDIYVQWIPVARPPTGQHSIGRVSRTGLVALVDLITLAFLKVSYISFPNVHIALRIYLSMAISKCSGEWAFQKWNE